MAWGVPKYARPKKKVVRRQPKSVGKAITRAAKPKPQSKSVGRAVTKTYKAERKKIVRKKAHVDKAKAKKTFARFDPVGEAPLTKLYKQTPKGKQLHALRKSQYATALTGAGIRPKKARVVAEKVANRDVRAEIEKDLKSDKSPDLKIAGVNVDKITGTSGRAALALLDETTRTSHGLAGAAHAGLKGENVLKAASRGYRLKERKTFKDVINQAGYTGPGASVAGFAGDVLLDPLTYATFGASAVAKQTAQKAGEKAAREAVERGASRKAVQKAKSQASRKAFAKAPKNKELTVGFGKHKTNTGIPLPSTPDVVRDKLGKAFPVRPKDITVDEWAKLTSADRRRRGTQLSETRRSARKATAVRKALGGAQRRVLPERSVAGGKVRIKPRSRKAPLDASRRVRDAIEAKDLTHLSARERVAAKAVASEQERLLSMRKAAGENPKRYTAGPGEAQGYVARQAAFEITDPKLRKTVGKREGWGKPKEKAAKGKPGRNTTTLKDFTRVERRPMNVVRAEKPGVYVEDIPTSMLAKGQKDVGRAANTQYRNEITQTLGKPLTPKTKWDDATEAVYTVKDGRLSEVKGKGFEGGKPDDFVVLKRSVAEHANKQVEGQKRIPFLDPLTNKVKWVLTVPNPQYWSRNYYGGMFNAWEEGANLPGLARAIPSAHRVSRRQGKIAKAEETLGKPPPKPKGKIRLGNKKVGVDDLVREIEHTNVSGGGITSELLGAETRRRSKMQVFEDAPRLAAYIYHRRKGLNPEQAVRRSMRSQFDYGALTGAELNVARRIFPFYTWRSRNVALQANTLVQRPGKLANVEKTRQFLADEAGLPDDWQDALAENEALGVPLPIPGGKQLAYLGLPINDLNFATADPTAWLQQLAGSSHPVAKAGVEFATGYSFFFRDRLEREGSKWYSAPDTVIDKMPAGLRKDLVKRGIIRMGQDRWTGEMTWQWRGKTDYLAKLTPITSTLLQAGTSGRSRKGQKTPQRVGAWLTGVRTQPYEPGMNRLYKKYDERSKVQDKIDDLIELRTHKTKKDKDTPEYAKLKKELKRLKIEVYELEGKFGKKVRSRDPRPKGQKGSSPQDFNAAWGESGGSASKTEFEKAWGD